MCHYYTVPVRNMKRALQVEIKGILESNSKLYEEIKISEKVNK